MNKFQILLALLFISGNAGSSFAQIAASPSIISFEQGSSPIKNVSIVNHGLEPLHARVEIFEVINPGEATETRSKSSEIIITPKSFSIPPTSDRELRLLFRGNFASKERVYRVQFIPRGSMDISEESVSGSSQILKVISSVGLLIFMQPKDSAPQLIWNRDKNFISFTNIGNSNLYLDRGEHCLRSTSDCEKILDARRLYPGNTWQVSVPVNRVARFRKSKGTNYQTISIPAEKG